MYSIQHCLRITLLNFSTTEATHLCLNGISLTPNTAVLFQNSYYDFVDLLFVDSRLRAHADTKETCFILFVCLLCWLEIRGYSSLDFQNEFSVLYIYLLYFIVEELYKETSDCTIGNVIENPNCVSHMPRIRDG